jgi:glycosyltransferase involved in cell wall biosynthesis
VSEGTDIVVPVFNEEATVGELAARLRESCPGARLIFVDNASTDGTVSVLRGLSYVQLVRHDRNLGYGRSIIDGIKASDGARVAVIDGDLEYRPEDVPAVLRGLESYHAVYGSRFLAAGERRRPMHWFRLLGNDTVTGFFNLLFAQHLTDVCTGIRAFRRSALPADGVSRDGFEMLLELSAKLLNAGARIGEVPVDYAPRRTGRSKMRHLPEFLKYACLLVAFRLAYPPLVPRPSDATAEAGLQRPPRD